MPDDDARVGKLVKYVNSELKKAHVPKVNFVTDQNKDIGDANLDHSTWTVRIGTRGGVSNLSNDEAADLGAAVYHEARHAEQRFRIARHKAETNPNIATLKSQLGIPQDVVEAAIKRPLPKPTKEDKFFRRQWYDRQNEKMTE